SAAGRSRGSAGRHRPHDAHGAGSGPGPAAVSTLTAVLGAGTMGAGIAQACATAGQRVLLLDVNEEAGGRALAGIGESLDRLVNRERLDAEAAAAAVGRIVTGTDYGRLAEADVVIEAVPEDLSVKEQVWREAAGA